MSDLQYWVSYSHTDLPVGLGTEKLCQKLIVDDKICIQKDIDRP